MLFATARAERVADKLYLDAGCDPGWAEDPGDLFTAITGMPVRLAPAGVVDGAASCATCMLVDAALGEREQRWEIASVLARTAIRRFGLPLDEYLERRVTAALLMPRVAFSLMSRSMGLDELAAAFVVRPCTAALRIGETTQRAVAVVAGVRWWTRGVRYPWPTNPMALHRLAKAPPAGMTAKSVEHVSERRLVLMAA